MYIGRGSLFICWTHSVFLILVFCRSPDVCHLHTIVFALLCLLHPHCSGISGTCLFDQAVYQNHVFWRGLCAQYFLGSVMPWPRRSVWCESCWGGAGANRQRGWGGWYRAQSQPGELSGWPYLSSIRAGGVSARSRFTLISNKFLLYIFPFQ